jgi:hypothetical protein
MKKNVGNTDKWIRIILGTIIVVLGIINQSWWGLVGIVPLATAFMGVCPAYLPFGISTCKDSTTSKKS